MAAGAVALAVTLFAMPQAALADSDSPGALREQNALTGNARSNRSGYRSQNRVNRTERRQRRINRAERRQRGINRAERRANRGFKYRQNRHGKCYRNRRSGFSHFYNGFWYSAPFWTYGYYNAPSYSYGPSDWELHVEWCYDRYRSYDERRDAFKGYDGLWHRCISPYSY